MDKMFPEFIPYSDEDAKKIWDNSIFVFDTNTLLDLYRYTEVTRNRILSAIEKIKDKLYMPSHVAYEFLKNRKTVIFETQWSPIYDKKIDRFIDDLPRRFSTEQTHELKTRIREMLEKMMGKSKISLGDDPIFQKIQSFFKNKYHTQLSDDDITKFKKDAESRYKEKIPPGYMDEKKDENKYGDLIIWKQILSYAKDKQENIILVTNDEKEDWWEICKGRTIGPRPELRREFSKESGGKMFHMYKINTFLEHSSVSMEKKKEIIDEVNNLLNTRREYDEQKKISTWKDMENKVILGNAYRKFNKMNEIEKLVIRSNHMAGLILGMMKGINNDDNHEE